MIDAQLLTLIRDSSRGFPGLPIKKDLFDCNSDLSESYKPTIPSGKLHPTKNGYSPQAVTQQQQQHSYVDDIGFNDVLHHNGGYCSSVLPYSVSSPGLMPQVVLQNGPTGPPRHFYDTEDETCDSEDVDSAEEYESVFDTEPDDPTKLLDFVQIVTRDLHGMFSRNKGSEDYCDIYEERFKTTLSGRELYYADLLALASNSEAPSSRSRRAAEKAPSDRLASSSPESHCGNSPTEATRTSDHTTIVYDARGEPQACHLPREGRCIAAYGLGPLEELFRRNGSTHCPSSTSTSHTFSQFGSVDSYSEHDGFRGYSAYRDSDLYGVASIPMTMRQLPNSFWIEPGNETKNVLLPAMSRTPDFSELFVQWGT